MKMPRVHCRVCCRSVAAGMVAGSPGKGRVWRHDPPDRRTQFGDSLVSCSGLLAIVELPIPGEQLEFVPVEPAADLDGIDTIALF
ncbi:hypothetical protein ACFY0A_39690 [Streptomyces sp. NPDC001698]|uniref:hypothetical protein n=1 Tax=Streptomyces sp. NPDC001698 TaxID=3364601 RepID=UPI0036CAEA8B